MRVTDFSLGDVAKFEILVENKFSDMLKGAFAQILVYDKNEEIIADFKSQTYDISPLEKVLMLAFWDTVAVEEGTYDSTIFLKSGEQQSVQQDLNLKLEISENEINIVGIGYVISKDGSGLFRGNTLTVVLITVIVVLIILNVLWFLVLRKKLSGRKK